MMRKASFHPLSSPICCKCALLNAHADTRAKLKSCPPLLYLYVNKRLCLFGTDIYFIVLFKIKQERKIM